MFTQGSIEGISVYREIRRVFELHCYKSKSQMGWELGGEIRPGQKAGQDSCI